jgi:hypothetical protein
MINYHMYRNYWPLMALGRYRTFLEGTGIRQPTSHGAIEPRDAGAVPVGD